MWEQLELPADGDGVCDVCKVMVLEARETLRSNQTRVSGPTEFGYYRLHSLSNTTSYYSPYGP